MTRYWGDESWRQVAYEARESYGMKYEVKHPHSHLPEAFRRPLIEVAGYKYVLELVLMRLDDLQGLRSTTSFSLPTTRPAPG